MQEIYNAGWYTNNEEIGYPLAPSATGIDDKGQELSTSIISDIRIVGGSPINYYITGVSVTPQLVTVVLGSAAGAVAAIAVQQPVALYTNYRMDTFTPGIAALIAFGSGARINLQRWAASTASQGLLDPSCVITIAHSGVSSITFEDQSHSVTLGSGPITLKGSNNLKLQPMGTPHLGYVNMNCEEGSISCRMTEGLDAEVTFELRGDTDADTRAINQEFYNILTCNADPDTSSDPLQRGGVQSINGVSPDDNGNINIISELDDLAVTWLSETDADDNITCSIVCFETDTPIPERTTKIYNDCGVDLCNDVVSESSNAATLSITALAGRAISLRTGVVPIQGSSVYINSVGLRPEDGCDRVIVRPSSDLAVISMIAKFEVEPGYAVGFIFGDGIHCIVASGSLQLGSDSIALVDLPTTFVLRVTHSADLLIASVLSEGATLGTLILHDVAIENPQLLLANGTCSGWSYE